MLMEWYNPIGKKLIELAEIQDDYYVLDVATGTGEPGLSAARYASKGNVIGVDISENMVKIANDFAKLKGVSNYKALHYDGTNLPFNNAHFDSVVSRCGIFFFPDTECILKEIMRVLKPGGKFSASGWRDVKENEMGLVVQTIVRDFLKQQLPSNDAPGPFRFSEPGKFKTELANAGFKDVSEVNINGDIKFDSKERYWQFLSEMQTPIINALKKTNDEQKEELKSEVYKTIRPFEINSQLVFKWSAYCIAGTKP